MIVRLNGIAVSDTVLPSFIIRLPFYHIKFLEYHHNEVLEMNSTTKILVTALLILALTISVVCIGEADADDEGGGFRPS